MAVESSSLGAGSNEDMATFGDVGAARELLTSVRLHIESR